MSYEVIQSFRGLKTNTQYKVGDTLDDSDFNNDLLNSNNQYHTPFIKEISDAQQTVEEKAKNSLNNLTVKELKEKADELEIDYPNNIKKSDLINLLES